MARYKVLRAIEHDGKLYLPEGAAAPEKPRSLGSGMEILTDLSGFINLAQSADEIGKIFNLGQLAPAPEAKPRKSAKEKEG